MRMYVVACPSPSLISSAAIVQGSPFISHLLASPLRRRRIFWAKSGCAPNGRPGTDAAVPPMHLKTENEIQCVRHSSGIGTKAIPSGGREAHFPLTDEGWKGVARLSSSHWVDQNSSSELVIRGHISSFRWVDHVRTVS